MAQSFLSAVFLPQNVRFNYRQNPHSFRSLTCYIRKHPTLGNVPTPVSLWTLKDSGPTVDCVYVWAVFKTHEEVSLRSYFAFVPARCSELVSMNTSSRVTFLERPFFLFERRRFDQYVFQYYWSSRVRSKPGYYGANTPLFTPPFSAPRPFIL